jgi:hypothetical protein
LCKQALPDELLLVLADGHLGNVRHLCAPPLLLLYRGRIKRPHNSRKKYDSVFNSKTLV